MTKSTQPTAAPSTDGPQAQVTPQPVLELMRHLLEQLSTLFRQELDLAMAELSRSLAVVLGDATFVAVGLALLFAGFLVLIFAAVLGLAFAMPAWLAAVLVGGVVLLIGTLLLGLGLSRFRAANLQPRRITESLRKDKATLTGHGAA